MSDVISGRLSQKGRTEVRLFMNLINILDVFRKIGIIFVFRYTD
jgi:hypothetical protein